jgi:site-specific recombinase XerD
MTRSTSELEHPLQDNQSTEPDVKLLKDCLPANKNFYRCFRRWLCDGGYGEWTVKNCGRVARLTLGLLDKPYWEINIEADIVRVRAYIADHFANQTTRSSYNKGLSKLIEYLYIKGRRTLPEKPVDWSTFIDPLPEWLHADIRDYIAHRRRSWLPDNQRQTTIACLSQLTLSLRWIVAQVPLSDVQVITPALWFDYVDHSLEIGRSPVTINMHLYVLQDFLRFLAEVGRPICQRMLRVRALDRGPQLHRDVPKEHIQQLLQAIESGATAKSAAQRRLGTMDRAWFLLMLTSGLRCGEVRRLRLDDLDLKGRRVRIIQSKGLKDRIVYLVQAAVDALSDYLKVRGPAATDHVFIFRHRPLTPSYCLGRMHTYSRRCSVDVKPHQLRHTCATILLNAGAPILTVQTILGHKYVDTTLRYARLYDGTVAADYYRAMDEIERRLMLQEETNRPAPHIGQLLALVDSLQAGTLNDAQQEKVQMLRAGLLALTERMVEAPDENETKVDEDNSIS